MASIPTSLVFSVKRRKPELVVPAKPTPHELKKLSDIDDQECLRFQIPVIQFYRYDPSMKGRDCVQVIREALSKTLVFYYPLAGRLREGPGRKLMVDCTGEGIIFIEADADVTLQQFGNALQPPFPCLDELLYIVPGSDGVLNCPLLLIQVTRLKCGGFIFALRVNHTMCDGAGLVQFMIAVGEIARGSLVPSTPPVWQREILSARDPPRVTCTHHEYDDVPDIHNTLAPLDDIVHRSFFFKPTEINTIRKHLPLHLRKCSTFEILTACLWRCRTIALQLRDPQQEVRMLCVVDSRPKLSNPLLPTGYYGNAIAYAVALTTAGKLCENPLGFALELVRTAKANVTQEYMHSLADLMVIRGRPHYTVVGSYLVSDVRRIGFRDVDFGWGKAAYGGPAKGGLGAVSFYIPLRDHNGDDGIVVPIFLQAPAMERFIEVINAILNEKDMDVPVSSKGSFINSNL